MKPQTTAGRRDASTEPLPVAPSLGSRLREMRLERGIGVRALSRAIDCSPSLVSQIELGRVVPSVGTLYALTSALGISMDSLFLDEEDGNAAAPATSGSSPGEVASLPTANEQRMIQRSGHRRAINLEHGVRWELLVPVPEPDVELMEVQFAVGGGNLTDHSTRHNGREYALVLEGVLAIAVGFEQYRLSVGDSLAFDSNIPHRIWNAGDIPVRAVWLVLGRMQHAPAALPSPETLHVMRHL